MDSLPPEIIAQIFRHLPQKDVFHLRTLSSNCLIAVKRYKIACKVDAYMCINGPHVAIFCGQKRWDLLLKNTDGTLFITTSNSSVRNEAFKQTFGLDGFGPTAFADFLEKFLPVVNCKIRLREINVATMVELEEQISEKKNEIQEICFTYFMWKMFDDRLTKFVKDVRKNKDVLIIVSPECFLGMMFARKEYFNSRYELHHYDPMKFISTFITLVDNFFMGFTIPEIPWKFIGTERRFPEDHKKYPVKTRSREDDTFSVYNLSAIDLIRILRIPEGVVNVSFNRIRSLDDIPPTFSYRRRDGVSLMFMKNADANGNLVLTYVVGQ